ncbi:MAG: enolase C-terminal domain-like protein [Candidatus Bathyarchaeota archaeon]
MRCLSIIEAINARKIFNSRGEETIEVEVKTAGGKSRAAAPAGKSKGKYEVEYYPKGGVDESVKLIRKLVEPKLLGVDAKNQTAIDKILHQVDGTENFGRIGGNASYAISTAIASAAALSHKKPLFSLFKDADGYEIPNPLGNVIGGGKHAGKGTPDIQEILVLPFGGKSFVQSFAANIRVHKLVGKFLEKKIPTFTGGKGDEGAWAPRTRNEDAIEMVFDASEKVSDETGISIRVALDVAASSFWVPKKRCYDYAGEKTTRSEGEQIDYILNLIEKYELAYVEDPLHEDDFEGFAELTKKAKKCLICGDDLFVTNDKKLRQGIRMKAANSIIIKPNQVGTISDAYRTVKLAKRAGYVPVISHRSGETCDGYLGHLAVSFKCPIIKTGIIGGERAAKLNELIRIEETLGKNAKMAKLKI